MASHDQSLQSDNLSPQPSTSAYPLEVTVIQANPGPSAPCVDSSPLPPATGGCKRNRKRKWSTWEESEEEPASRPENAWVVETLSSGQKTAEWRAPPRPRGLPQDKGGDEGREGTFPGDKTTRVLARETVRGLKMTLKKMRTSTVLPEHHEAFARLLKDPVVKGFLEWDKSLRLTDKYLLAMVIAYFSRVGPSCWQYQRIHFFLALYLAVDMEGDYHAPKEAIFSFLYGDSNCARRPLFHKLRFQFFRSMGYRARVTREECEEIQAFDPELWVWKRDRSLLLEIREPEVAAPTGDPSSQQQVSPDANDRRAEGKEEPPAQRTPQSPE